MSVHANWDGIIDKNEDILWQGRPDGELQLRPQNIPVAIFGICFAGFDRIIDARDVFEMLRDIQRNDME